ncbi:cellulosome enzyme [Cladochytrium replicatum]|nr:cellulosome enzyme [Cladochytrium replicatum]
MWAEIVLAIAVFGASGVIAGPGDITFNLGKTTGAFHGGASGSLYGLYVDGLPTRNLIEGMNLRTVSTKAQDGPQHPGADALEVLKPLADSTGGDVYIYMTDIYRGFPYEWPGSTPEEKLNDFMAKIVVQVDQVLTLEQKYQDRVVFVPFNEPEGNMFGDGTWSYNKISWRTNPTDYFRAWDQAFALIRSKMPKARIAGPNTSILYEEVRGFMNHTLAKDTFPDVITWHELSNPAVIRTSVAKYRSWEDELFVGTKYAGKHFPINVNEYAFNYHTSVPGQMIQWVSAIEDSKIDADIAYWNIDGNIGDTTVQANRGNGQWWLLNAYGQMTGQTVAVIPPSPGVSYTLQGVATIDVAKKQARALFGGAAGNGIVTFTNIDKAVFGDSVHAIVQEIVWTGQIGDSAQPRILAEVNQAVVNNAVTFNFGTTLPALVESSAYFVILTPNQGATSPSVPPVLWTGSYEAESATYTGSGYSKNGPEGTPSDVGKFFTSGTFNVGGLRTNSNGVLTFSVTVPSTGNYDLAVIANSLNTYSLVADQGPTNVFMRVDGGAEQELFLTLGYKWVVWDHCDTKVYLTQGTHTIALAAASLDGKKVTKGDAIIDRIILSLPNPASTQSIYEAEYATLSGGATTSYGRARSSGSGGVSLTNGQSATFWVYSPIEGESSLDIDTQGDGRGVLTVNGEEIGPVASAQTSYKVFLAGGVNKVTVTGTGSAEQYVDRIAVRQTTGSLLTTWYEAESASINGDVAVVKLSLASGGSAVTNIGGSPGNSNTLTFNVTVPSAGKYVMTVRYSNPEQSPATHYNPDPLARHADITINGDKGGVKRVWFPHSFHINNFWELSLAMKLRAGSNSIQFASQELPDFNGKTYISERLPADLLRSKVGPIVDRIGITPLRRVLVNPDA